MFFFSFIRFDKENNKVYKGGIPFTDKFHNEDAMIRQLYSLSEPDLIVAVFWSIFTSFDVCGPDQHLSPWGVNRVISFSKIVSHDH